MKELEVGQHENRSQLKKWHAGSIVLIEKHTIRVLGDVAKESD